MKVFLCKPFSLSVRVRSIATQGRITDFVVIDYTDYPERERRNPKNQEIVTVPAERLPKARFSANFEKKQFHQNELI